jgi:hypothetical protein
MKPLLFQKALKQKTFQGNESTQGRSVESHKN